MKIEGYNFGRWLRDRCEWQQSCCHRDGESDAKACHDGAVMDTVNEVTGGEVASFGDYGRRESLLIREGRGRMEELRTIDGAAEFLVRMILPVVHRQTDGVVVSRIIKQGPKPSALRLCPSKSTPSSSRHPRL